MMRLEPRETYDEAIIGVADRIGQDPILAYSTETIIEILMEDGMSDDEAIEYFEFNILGAWVGEGTPIFVSKVAQLDN